MNRKVLSLIISIVFLMPSFTRGQVSRPDFSHPKNVDQQAEADLTAAIKAHNAHAALNALIRRYLAQAIIDPEDAQQAIERTDSVAQLFPDSPLQGVFKALLAQMYNNVYQTDRWTYMRRQLPLTPLPEDIHEWSGAQFENKINELCRESYSEPEALNALKLYEYSDLVNADRLTLLYFPTMLDFVYANASELMSDSDFPNIPLSYSGLSEGCQIYWQCAKIQGYDKENPQKFKDLFLKYQDSQLASYILGSFVEQCDVADIDDGIPEDAYWALEQMEAFNQKFPRNPFYSWLEELQEAIKQERVTVKVPQYCQANCPVELKVTNQSAPSASIDVYYVGEKIIKRSKISSLNLEMLRPVATYSLSSDSKKPFQQDSAFMFTPEKDGTYLILPKLPSGTISDDYATFTYCVPAFPLIFDRSAQSYISALSPVTGSPVTGLKVYLKKKDSKVYAGLSDKDGLVNVTRLLKKGDWNYAYVEFEYKGITYDLNETIYSLMRSSSKPSYYGSILTDRSLYHPGDSIHALAVLYQNTMDENGVSTSEVAPDYELTATLYDVNHQKVADLIGTTDEFGRMFIDFVAPESGLTGNYRIEISAKNVSLSTSLTISDYKMPDFEIIDVKSARLSSALDTVRVEGRAMSYSGFPMANAKIDLEVTKASWWRWFLPTSESIYFGSANTDIEGRFQFDVPVDSLEERSSFWTYFVAKISATSSSGTSAQAQAPFSLGKQYRILIQSQSHVIDGLKPFSPDIKVYDIDGNEASMPLKWNITQDTDTVAAGTVGQPINLSTLKPGSYTLNVESNDPSLADSDSFSFVLYNTSTDIVPANNGPVWLLKDSFDLPATGPSHIDVLMGCPNPDTYYYLVLADYSKVYSVSLQKDAQGYRTLSLDIPADFSNGYAFLVGIRDCNQFQQTITLTRKEDRGLVIEGSSMRDRLTPSAEENWEISVKHADGSPVRAAIVLDMYNKALEAILPHSLNMSSGYYVQYSSLTFSSPYNYLRPVNIHTSLGYFSAESLGLPSFNFYGVDLGVYSSRMYAAMLTSRPKKGNAMMEDVCLSEESADAMAMPTSGADGGIEEKEVTEEIEQPQKPEEEVDYRDADVPMAIWAPALTTDSEGNLRYAFRVPNANTTWRLQAVAWTKDMNIGKLIRDFVANKPIMVQPNVPRYLRAGDVALIKATVMNNSDSDITASSAIEFFNPVTGAILASHDFSDSIPAMGSVDIQAWVEAPVDGASIGYRVKASNGSFSDGEQGAFPILPSQSSLVETTPFYLNPGDTSWEMQLPADKNARLSLTFSENPVWTIVSALPGLRKDAGLTANSAAAAIYAASISKGLMDANPNIAVAIKEWLANPSDSTLISSLEKNEDLKIALLNCTPWVQAAQSDTERMANLALIFNNKEIKKTVDEGLKLLAKLQREDGGWSWGDWSNESSAWVTGNVLTMMGDLKEMGWLPKSSDLNKMIEKAVKFWDGSWAKDWKENSRPTDILYTIIRPQFSDIPVGLYGQKVISNTVQEINKNWKGYNDPAYKAMAAIALYNNKYENMAKQLMGSVDQFGKWTKDQGLRFPSVNALYDYAILLEAYAKIEPESKAVDGLRQQLIVRKQGADWGSAVVTMEVVRSILSSGSTWTVPAQGAVVKCGDTSILPATKIEKYTGAFRADLSPYFGTLLSISTSGVGPAYGAVYAQFQQDTQEVKASSCDDLSIEKKIAVSRGQQWEYATDSLKVGDRVKVVLTIHCRRNLSYVTIIDERAAALQPVDQVPGWLWSEGVGFYRENRDDHTGLFVSFMQPGTYQLTYELNVNTAGTFTGGVASIQSQYAPELSAHSSGSSLIVRP